MKVQDGVWWDEMWNPVYGCTKISPACDNCYAERLGKRFHGHFNVTIREDVLEKPLRWRRPRVVFVCGMSDLFHESVPDEFIERVFEVAFQRVNQHTFIFLTKRAARMATFVESIAGHIDLSRAWLGVTVENQEQADLRIPHLIECPAQNRFISVEPMLGPIGLPSSILQRIKLVICGGESGPLARPVNPFWVSSLQHQCHVEGTSFFFKQWGEWLPDCQNEKKGFIGNGNARVGKQQAGRKLDGVEYLNLPWGNKGGAS